MKTFCKNSQIVANWTEPMGRNVSSSEQKNISLLGARPCRSGGTWCRRST